MFIAAGLLVMFSTHYKKTDFEDVETAHNLSIILIITLICVCLMGARSRIRLCH